ncbi:hypothetical protein RhiJN_22415 [Ceratobasidium sp. AG-Ba]|nr:hypothetical protein RhiJN_22415 [Ceratobasidium sp. AG-Ba]
MMIAVDGQTISSESRIDNAYIYDRDSNPGGIQFSDGWVHYSGDDGSSRYLDTLSSTIVTNASFVFFFKGSALSYWGDATDQSHPTIYASVDGKAERLAVPQGPSHYQGRFFSELGLDAGDHQLVVGRPGYFGRPGDGVDFSIGLDFLQGATIVPVGAALIDGGDDRVHYQGSWSALKPNARRSFYYGGLQHSTITPGDSVTFSFLGTAVWYFSDKRAENGWAKISVDGGEAELVSTFIMDG